MGHFWVREDELYSTKSYQLLLHYWAKTHWRSGFDVQTVVLHSQEKKKCSKNGGLKSGSERKCCRCYNPMGNRLHLITMHEYEYCSACPWYPPQLTVTGWGFCTSSGGWQLFKWLTPTSSKMTSVKPSHKWHTFKCTQCGVTKTTRGRQNKKRKKRERERELNKSGCYSA